MQEERGSELRLPNFETHPCCKKGFALVSLFSAPCGPGTILTKTGNKAPTSHYNKNGLHTSHARLKSKERNRLPALICTKIVPAAGLLQCSQLSINVCVCVDGVGSLLQLVERAQCNVCPNSNPLHSFKAR